MDESSEVKIVILAEDWKKLRNGAELGDPSRRVVWFFETRDRALEAHGVIVRARIGKKGADTTVELRGVAPGPLEARFGKHPGFKIESGCLEQTSTIAVSLTVDAEAWSCGRSYLAPTLPRPGLDDAGGKRRDGGGARLDDLSPREREIFDLLVQSHSNREIAKHLYISVKTVETHRASINRKLGVHSTAELIRFAALRGLVHE